MGEWGVALDCFAAHIARAKQSLRHPPLSTSEVMSRGQMARPGQAWLIEVASAEGEHRLMLWLWGLRIGAYRSALCMYTLYVTLRVSYASFFHPLVPRY